MAPTASHQDQRQQRRSGAGQGKQPKQAGSTQRRARLEAARSFIKGQGRRGNIGKMDMNHLGRRRGEGGAHRPPSIHVLYSTGASTRLQSRLLPPPQVVYCTHGALDRPSPVRNLSLFLFACVLCTMIHWLEKRARLPEQTTTLLIVERSEWTRHRMSRDN